MKNFLLTIGKTVALLILVSSINTVYAQSTLKLTAIVTAGTGTGSIAVSPQGGTSPYTYSWNSGETTSSIVNKINGTYTVTVTDAASTVLTKSYTLGYKINWVDFVNTSPAADNSLNKVSGYTNTYDAAAASLNNLLANTDGWFEFVVNTVGGGDVYLYGFASANIGTSPNRLNYAININNSNIQVWESGVVTSYGTAVVGDIFRISREGANIKYYKNGSVIRTIAAINAALEIGTSINTGHAAIVTSSFRPAFKVTAVITGSPSGSIVLTSSGGTSPYTYSWSSGETTSSITNKANGLYTVAITDGVGTVVTKNYNIGYKVEWADLLSVSIGTDNSLTKTSGYVNNFDTGSGSYNALPANTDGSFEFVVNTLGPNYFFGLTSSNINVTPGRLNYSFTVGAYGNASIYEFGVQPGIFFIAREGDVLRISREAGNIKYYKNGALLRTVAAVMVPLQVGSSIAGGTTPVVTCTFLSELKIAAVVTGSPAGGIALTVQGGSAPYTYNWSNGETTSAITNKSNGLYTVTVTDAAGTATTRSFSIGYKVTWADVVNVGIATDNSLIKAGGYPNTPDAGTGSYNELAANADGWFEFVINTVGNGYYFGLASSNVNVSSGRLNYCIAVNTGNNIVIWESGVYTSATAGVIRQGDVFRIGREAGNIKYYKNGVLLRSVPAVSVPLQVASTLMLGTTAVATTSILPAFRVTGIVTGSPSGGVALSIQGGTSPFIYSWSSGETTSSISNKAKGLYSVTVTDAAGTVVTKSYNVGYKMDWADITNVTIAGDNSLTKTSGVANQFNAGTGSYNALAANTDGSVEFVIGPIATDNYEIGLTSSNNDTGTSRLSNAMLVTAAGSIAIYELGAVTQIGMIREGDVFKISREGTSIKYYKNGVVLRTVGATMVPLQVGTSISVGRAPIVTCSFLPAFKVTGIVTGNPSGSIALSIQGGTSPFAYSWSSGETTSSISNKANGTYSVTITDADGTAVTKSYNLGYQMSWADKTNVSVGSDNSLTKVGGIANLYDAGTGSYNALPADTDGWLEFVIGPIATDNYQVGFTILNNDLNTSRLNYAMSVNPAGAIMIYEVGAVTQIGMVRVGDVFRIAREGGVIKYYKNGVVLRTVGATNVQLQVGTTINVGRIPIVTCSFRPEFQVTATITSNPSSSIFVNAQGGTAPYTYKWSSGETIQVIYNKPNGLYTVTVTDAVGVKVTRSYPLGLAMDWKDLTNVTVNSDKSLSKIGSVTLFDAGTGSNNVLAANMDGWFSFVVNTVGDTYIIGLTTIGTTGVSTSRLHHAISINANREFSVYELGAVTKFGKVREGDMFRISREQGAVKYYRNEVLLRVVGANTGALQIGSSIYLRNTPVLTASFDATIVTTTPVSLSIDNLGYQYKYDAHNRMTHKKLPGADWVYMVYDNLDRLVMTQDGVQRVANKWSYTKYDALNRPVMNGIYTHTSTVDQGWMSSLISTDIFSEAYNADAATHGYTNTVFPKLNTTVLSATYYDDYLFRSMTTGLTYLKETDLATQPAIESTATKTLATGSKVNILGSTNYLFNITYYDDKQRVIQNVSQNAKNGIDRVTNLLDFAGKVISSKSTHTNPAAAANYSIARNFEYDHGQRLLKSYHQILGGPKVLIAKNEYNELGQLIDKKLHSTDETNFKQSVDYRYNIRGWLTSINNATVSNDGVTNNDNDDLFGMEFGYNKSIQTGNSLLYNGNISAIKWSKNMALDPASKSLAYNYGYDTLNRIKSAAYQTLSGPLWNPVSSFSEDGYMYDLNGNIKALTRKNAAGANMDKLTYAYGTGTASSNKLISVSDAGDVTAGFADGNTTSTDYTYDKNGNMITDANKGITAITYNHLNLPVQVNKGASNYIVYTYDATGRKLNQQVFGTTPKSTDYLGEFNYEGNVLKFISHEEGRIIPGSPNVYEYNLKDHLGNVRMTFTSKVETQADLATLETANLATEAGAFLNINSVRRVNGKIFDHTHTTGTPTATYSIRLSGSANEKIGLAKSLSVMPGDKITAEVYGKFVSGSGNDQALIDALTTIASTLSGSITGAVVDGAGYATAGSATYPFTGKIVHDGTEDTSGPMAYLNYFIFDRNFLPITGGFKRLSSKGKDQGDLSGGTGLNYQDNNYDRLYFEGDDIVIKQPGYVYVWLSNDDPNPVEVFFDDFKVTHLKSPVIQTEDYYAFGLTFNSYQRENSVADMYQYNSKEFQDELNLGWMDYGTRMYDVSMGRFLSNDPIADLMPTYSQYSYSYNNPLRFNDPSGMAPVDGIDKSTKHDPQRDDTPCNCEQHPGNNKIDEPPALSTIIPSGKSNPIPEERDTRRTNPYNPLKYPISAISFEVNRIIDGVLNFINKPAPPDLPFGPQSIEYAALKVVLVAKDKNVLMYTVKNGERTIEVLANFVKQGNKLILQKLHIGGDAKNEFGIKKLFEAAREIGRQEGATEVIIEGGMRSTGKLKGTVPSVVKIKVD